MSDSQWIQRALERFEGPLMLQARRLTGDLESARDVVQETFLRLCRERREEIEPRLAPWLFRVCRNAALDRRRRERPVDTLDDHSAAPGEQTQPVDRMIRDEAGRRALASLEQLPERQREVLGLRFQGGLSYAQIAEVTGDSLGNVGYLIHVGLKTLRERLAGDALEELAS